MMRGLAAHERRHAEHGILAAKAIQEPGVGPRARPDVPGAGPLGRRRRRTRSSRSTRARTACTTSSPRQIPFEPDPEDARVAIASCRSPLPAFAGRRRRRIDRHGAPASGRNGGSRGRDGRAVGAGGQRRRRLAAVRRRLPVGSRPWQRAHPAAASGSLDAWPGARSTGRERECAEAEEFFALADEVKHGICRADERARRAFVYPGTRRDLQAKFRLYWGGWDRACP